MATAEWVSAVSAALNILLLILLARVYTSKEWGGTEENLVMLKRGADNRCPLAAEKAAAVCPPCAIESPTKQKKLEPLLTALEPTVAPLNNSMLRAPLKPLFMGRLSESLAMPDPDGGLGGFRVGSGF